MFEISFVPKSVPAIMPYVLLEKENLTLWVKTIYRIRKHSCSDSRQCCQIYEFLFEQRVCATSHYLYSFPVCKVYT